METLTRQKKTVDMTEGRLFGKILLFVLPLIATNLLQVLYNAADMMVVSLSPEKDAVGAIGTTGAFVSMLLYIYIGFSTGANVMVARRLGAKDDKLVSDTVHTAMTLSFILGTVTGIIGALISHTVLSAMGAEGRLLELATTYTIIYFMGMPFMAMTNYAAAIFRAKGDTKTPLAVISISGLLNVLLNLFFVLVMKLSVEGVALATAIANLASAVTLLLKLSREDGPCRFSFKKIGINKNALICIVKIGLPSAIQGALFSVSNIIIQSSLLRVNNLVTPEGAAFAPVMKGNAAVSNLNGFVYQATTAVEQASITFTSQNAGAGKYSRIPRLMGICYAFTVTIALTFSLTIYALRNPLLSLYGVTEGAVGTLEHIAYETALKRLRIETLFYFVIGFMDVSSGVVRGLGRSLTSTVITFIGACIFRIVWIFTVFEALLNVESIYVSYPISWLITGVAQLIAVIILLTKLRKKEKKAV